MKMAYELKDKDYLELWMYFQDKAISVKGAITRGLEDRGATVWLDAHRLKLGDSLRKEIQLGLSMSRYGLVILSKAFFSKQWTQWELNALSAREESGDKVILPIWHGITREDVLACAPLLADRLAVDTSIGLDSVVQRVVTEVPVLDKRPVITWRRFIEKCQESPILFARDYLVRCPTCSSEVDIETLPVHEELVMHDARCSNCGWESQVQESRD